MGGFRCSEWVQTPRGQPAAGHGAGVGAWAAHRSLYVDNVKVLLIAAIIVGHAFGSYTTTEMFAYADVREATLAPVTEAVLIAGLVLVILIVVLLFLLENWQ